MQAVKVRWAGQTFALARCGETQGKKNRIRKTKEERKSMVEKFLKTYRESNNGNFPSLNLTHKEVGGSFYTVREIVRDIIQENRILGPGDLASKVLTLEDFCDQTSIGTPCVDRVDDLSSSMNKKVAEDDQIEGLYGEIIDGSSSDMLLTSNNISLNGDITLNVSKPELNETLVSPLNKIYFSQHLNEVDSGYELNASPDNSSFHKSQDVAQEPCLGGHLLYSENIMHGEVSVENHTGSSDNSGDPKVEPHTGLSQARTEMSSSIVLPETMESDIDGENLNNLLTSQSSDSNSNPVELSDSVILNQAPNEVMAVNGDIHTNVVSSLEVPDYCSRTTEPDLMLPTLETNGAVSKGIHDVTLKEEHSSSPDIRDDSSSEEFKEKGNCIDVSEENHSRDFHEKNIQIASVDAVMMEPSRDVTQNASADSIRLNLMPLKPSILELSSSNVSEMKLKKSEQVPSFSSDNINGKESSINGNLKDLLAPSSNADLETKSQITTSMISNVVTKENLANVAKDLLAPSSNADLETKSQITASMISNVVTKENLANVADRQLTMDLKKEKKMPQPDPFWDALKKLVAAFIKFWTE